MTQTDALIGSALALIDCYYGEGRNPLVGWTGLGKFTFAEYHEVPSGAIYDEALSRVSVPVNLFDSEFDPMNPQVTRRAWFQVTFSRTGARIVLDLESATG